MAMNPLDGLVGTPPTIARPPVTAVVTKITPDGVYAAPINTGDHRTPIGPCRGAGLDIGDPCLLVWTQESPWALAAPKPGGGTPGEKGDKGDKGDPGDKGTRMGTTPVWVFGTAANVLVAFNDGPPRVGDLVVSNHPWGIGSVERVTAVVDATHADLANTGVNLRGPAGEAAPTPTVLTASAAANLIGSATIGAWQAGTTASLPWIAFTAPPSGIVQVMVTGTLRPPADGLAMLHDFEIRTGDVFGAGTVVRGPILGTAAGNYNAHHIRTQGGGRVTGLTAGAKYHVRSMYHQAGTGSAGGQITNAYMELITH